MEDLGFTGRHQKVAPMHNNLLDVMVSNIVTADLE